MQPPMPQPSSASSPVQRRIQAIGFAAGPALALLAIAFLPDAYVDAEGRAATLGWKGRVSCGVAIWMATWWLTEAIELNVTALLPMALFPLLGARTLEEASRPYGHHLIFLYLGGFLIALALERWGLHRRIALTMLAVVGPQPRRMLAGFMVATAGLSLWVSNTATTLLMLPIALSVVDLVRQRSAGAADAGEEPGEAAATGNLAVCLMLGIAYSASIGGIGTLVGTPPNAWAASFFETKLGTKVSFVRWLGFGVPFVVVLLPIAWWLLACRLFPVSRRPIAGGAELVRRELESLGAMRRGEWLTLVVFGLAALCWLTSPWLTQWRLGDARPLAGLSDSGIAMLAAVALFAIPVDRERREFILDWRAAGKIPWGTLLLFGGGLSLADAIDQNGVGKFIGEQVAGLKGIPAPVLLFIVIAIVVYLGELASNLAAVVTLLPILAGVAPSLGMSPFELCVPAAIASSLSFMMPVGTPPNAVVFGTGHVSMPQMVKAGFWLDLIGIALVWFLNYAIVAPMFRA
jgi:sodium-dependent dicarboxylate transporter 2/3/5